MSDRSLPLRNGPTSMHLFHSTEVLKPSGTIDKARDGHVMLIVPKVLQSAWYVIGQICGNHKNEMQKMDFNVSARNGDHRASSARSRRALLTSLKLPYCTPLNLQIFAKSGSALDM